MLYSCTHMATVGVKGLSEVWLRNWRSGLLYDCFYTVFQLEDSNRPSLLVLCSVSEFSDENMMDPYNLAICFGPTLLRAPPHCDPVQHHPHIVELVRNILIHQEDIFLGNDMLSDGSTYYERCFIEDEEGCRVQQYFYSQKIYYEIDEIQNKMAQNVLIMNLGTFYIDDMNL